MGEEYLVKFLIRLGMYRGGTDLFDVSVMGEDQYQLVRKAMDNSWQIDLYEVMGKHSDVSENLANAKMVSFTLLSKDPDEIALFKKWFPDCWVGNFSIVDELERKIEDMSEEELEEYGLK